MKLKYYISSLLFPCLSISSLRGITPRMKVNPDERGVGSLAFQGADNIRSYIDHGECLGDLNLAYETGGKGHAISLADTSPQTLPATSDKIWIS